ncbi:hypothetical protein SB397_23550 [Burkholderia multivorans]|uniref:hypothetical protein n=1 Tax=Burkholderia multivorans TaxID=87883 RepID=UPI000D004139|nr:hypothetical protein [Burkholderia multivorans]MEB2488556.1 hypothetical protein [Burkholderia multivorans]MEB2570653.1 hypothetical protein [Burkholderia multivorans]PRF55556.1 hypothetical protein C6Q11_04845 [Burkholderia multivorans]
MNVHAEICPHCRSDVEGYGEILMESMRREERRRSGELQEPSIQKSEWDLSDPDFRLFLTIILSIILFTIFAGIWAWVIGDHKFLHYLLILGMSISGAKSMIEHLAKK